MLSTMRARGMHDRTCLGIWLQEMDMHVMRETFTTLRAYMLIRKQEVLSCNHGATCPAPDTTNTVGESHLDDDLDCLPLRILRLELISSSILPAWEEHIRSRTTSRGWQALRGGGGTRRGSRCRSPREEHQVRKRVKRRHEEVDTLKASTQGATKRTPGRKSSHQEDIQNKRG